MQLTEKHQEYWRKNLVITAILLFIWFVVTFVEAWYARELNAFTFIGFPLGFYMSAQGSLVDLRRPDRHLRLVHEPARHGVRRRRGRRRMNQQAVMSANKAFFNQLQEVLQLLHRRLPRLPRSRSPSAEQMGMSRRWIGYWFLFATIALYAGIGIMSRTVDAAEYYVAGRRVPAFFNGMATGADWMSAASFIGMAGTLYLSGFDGLAFVMGWTGGYVLVALFLAPYLRKFGQFTIPDFLGERYGGNIVRSIGIFAAILCSFTYVVAQIYGVGLITSRFTGLEFGIGVFVGLGGILVCSFLGGMRAVTWTQVAQYIILIIAYLTPGGLAVDEAHRQPDPADRLRPGAAEGDRAREGAHQRSEGDRGPRHLQGARGRGGREAEGRCRHPTTPRRPRSRRSSPTSRPPTPPPTRSPPPRRPRTTSRRTRQPPRPHGRRRRASRRAPHLRGRMRSRSRARTRRRRTSRACNFLGIVFCMMFGTAALPHILMRYYTTPSVKQARQSVTWSLFFIFLLYFTAPALAVLAKFDVYHFLVGSSFAKLAGLGGELGEGRSIAAVDHRHQQGRHRAAGGDRAGRRHHRAGHAGDRGPAVRGLGPGGGRRPRGGALDRRRPAAHDRQRALARPLLQDDRPATRRRLAASRCRRSCCWWSR